MPEEETQNEETTSTTKKIVEIVNLTEEIRKIIQPFHEGIQNTINSFINDYEIQNTIEDEDNSQPINGKSVVDYVRNQLNTQLDTISETYATKDNLNNYTTTSNLEKNYATKTYVSDTFENISFDLEGHSLKFPKETTKTADQLIVPGYYQVVNDNDTLTLACEPDQYCYNNGLVRVERQGNHIIQHINTTSPTLSGEYKIDGKEFIRHGYIPNSENDTIARWDKWNVAFLPWAKRDDLFNINKNGTNVDPNSFHLYECTSGYVFEWTQLSSDKRYILPMEQYTYATVCEFTKELPIQEPMIFSNYIGHMDLKITKTKIEIRSSNNKGEYIVGVSGNYFIPRTN